MLDALIVGGGIHGTLLSRVLVHEARVSRERLRVLDPWPAPLHRWRECTEAVGMGFLRSAGVHHLAPEPFALKRLAQTIHSAGGACFRGPYQRPSLALFQASCEAEVARFGLAELRLRGWARALAPLRAGGWRIDTDEGGLEARKVVLAIGSGEQQAWPEWARELRLAGGRVGHVLEAGFARPALGSWSEAVVIGGGVSALQVAMALARERPGGVTLLSRHRPRSAAFDSDPCWLGPKCLADFARVKDLGERRRQVDQARNRGSAPSEVVRSFQHAQRQGRVGSVLGEVAAARWEAGRAVLELAGRDERLGADVVVLATGFGRRRPGAPWLDDAVEAHGLRCAPCGYPAVDRALCWQRGLYVTGALAELEIGPVARNIHGARLAGRRLSDAVG